SRERRATPSVAGGCSPGVVALCLGGRLANERVAAAGMAIAAADATPGVVVIAMEVWCAAGGADGGGGFQHAAAQVVGVGDAEGGIGIVEQAIGWAAAEGVFDEQAVGCQLQHVAF